VLCSAGAKVRVSRSQALLVSVAKNPVRPLGTT
jgi:hypothetical protein